MNINVNNIIEGIFIGIFVAGLISLGKYLLDNKFKRKHKIEINYKNIILASIVSQSKTFPDNHYAIAVYGLKIINMSAIPFTLKELTLQYQYDDKIFKINSYFIQTGLLANGISALMLKKGNSIIFLMNWLNIHKYMANKLIEQGGVINASALFVLEDNISIDKLQNVKLIIKDYYDNERTIDIHKQYLKSKDMENLFIINRKFQQLDTNKIEWL